MLAVSAGGDLGREVAVGGGDQPDVNGELLHGTYRTDPLGLERA